MKLSAFAEFRNGQPIASCRLSTFDVKLLARCVALRSLVALLILCMTELSFAQQAPVLSKQASAVKRTADQLAPNARISVITVQGNEQFGNFASDDSEGFTFFDIDSRKNVTLRFEEVRKIKKGYAGVNSLYQKHTDRTRVLVVTVVFVGIIAGVIAAAASAKN